MDKNDGLKSTTTGVDSTESTDDGWDDPDPDSNPQSTEPTATPETDAAEDVSRDTAEETSPPSTEETVPTTEPEPVPVDTPVITPPEESPASDEVDAAANSNSLSCSTCGKLQTKEFTLGKCACRTKLYCDSQCQKKDRKQHKKEGLKSKTTTPEVVDPNIIGCST